MTLRSRIAKAAGKSAYWALKTLTGGGSSLPGKIALTLDPQVLNYLSEHYDVAIVTGTNGKTLTTALTVAVLEAAGEVVVTNPTGSNMQQGIVTVFLTAETPENNRRGKAVLEVDEGSLKHVVKYLKPKVFLHTNLFPDQVDRFARVEDVYEMLVAAAREVPEATVIANGDLPIFNSVDLPNPRQYFGFDLEKPMDGVMSPAPGVKVAAAGSHVEMSEGADGTNCPVCDQPLTYSMVSYANQGEYHCENCGLTRPNLDYRVTELNNLDIDGSTFTIDGKTFTIPVAGTYNIYNALAANSLARYLGIAPETIAAGFQSAQRVFGRQEQVTIEGKEVLINLVKNPVGLNQVLNIVKLEKEPITLAVILNNDYADGQDTSWIEQGEFEDLQELDIRQTYVSGSRQEDMYDRLIRAGFASESMALVENSPEALIEEIKAADTEQVHILATYTAMLKLRKALSDAGYLE